jgi:WD40 repeat protein
VVWDVKTGTSAVSAPADSRVWSAVWSADGNWLATAGDTGAQLWKVATPKVPGPPLLERHGDLIPEARRKLALSGDGSLLAAVDAEGVARLWQIAGRGEVGRMMEPEGVGAVALAPDGHRLVTGSGASLRFWPAEKTGEWVRFAGDKAVQAVAFSHGGHWLAMTGDDRAVRVAAVPAAIVGIAAAAPEGWPAVARLALPTEAVSLAWSPDDRWLAAATAGTLAVIDTRNWKIVAQPPIACEIVDWSADGRWLVARDGRTLHWIRAVEWTALSPVAYHGSLTRVSFSPEGQWVATWTRRYRAHSTWQSDPEPMRIYEAATGRRVAWPSGGRMDLLRQEAEASWGAVRIEKPDRTKSADGQWQVERTGSGSVSLQDIASHRDVEDYGGAQDFAFSPDSRWLATAAADGAVRVWPLTPLDRIAQACSRLSRNLKETEWPPELHGAVSKTCPNLP